jgi:CO/xanthine dehydrogenase FAD-binding subunit
LYVCASCVGNFRIRALSPVVIKQKYDLLAQAVEAVASSQIRNQGTIGGAVSQDVRAAINPFCS